LNKAAALVPGVVLLSGKPAQLALIAGRAGLVTDCRGVENSGRINGWPDCTI